VVSATRAACCILWVTITIVWRFFPSYEEAVAAASE
jgi:hypothetical protein